MKKQDYSKLSGKALSDACARMMDWHKQSGHWFNPSGGAVPTIHWYPHECFNQCRIVEDYIRGKGLWFYKKFLLNLGGQMVCMISLPEQRLRAALAAVYGHYVEQLTPAKKTGRTK